VADRRGASLACHNAVVLAKAVVDLAPPAFAAANTAWFM